MKKLFVVMIFSAAIDLITFAQDGTNLRGKEYNINKNGCAIGGYDPVSYFSAQKAIKGKKDYQVIVHGITYQFSTQRNEDAFKKDPARFEPQFGGWCAYAMGTSGTKVEVDPETFKISDGKLYLFYNRLFNNTMKSWNKDEMNLKYKAEANWAKINQE